MEKSIIGMKFGRLTVIGESGRSSNKAILWKCKCECGSITVATSTDLRSGHKKSCGCLKKVSHAVDLKGQRFGMLVVNKRAGTNKHRKALWRCKCDCGKFTTVSSVDLKSGNTKSCGCLGSNFAKRNILLKGSEKL
jgi:hypothetical protein